MKITRKQASTALRSGGMNVFSSFEATIQDRKGVKLEQQTGAGLKTRVYQLRDPRVDLTETQRAVGQCFGAYYEMEASGGAGGQWLREFVDSSPMSPSGASASSLHRSRMIKAAAKALKAAAPITYKPQSSRGGGIVGAHHPVSQWEMAYYVCVYQRSLSWVALRHGWTVTPITDAGSTGVPRVPNRQKAAMSDGLRAALDTISGAWDAGGYVVPVSFSTVTESR